MKDSINSSELDALIDACLDDRLSEAEADKSEPTDRRIQ